MKLIIRKVMLRIVLFLLPVMLLIGSCIVTASAVSLDDVSPLLVKLESAYNRKDLVGIIECFDPSIANVAKATAGLMGINSNEYDLLLPLADGLFSVFADQSGTWPTCKLTARSYNGDEYAGTLEYNVRLIYDDESVDSFEESVKIKKTDSEWYISAYQGSSVSFTGNNKKMISENIAAYSDITADDLTKDIVAVETDENNTYSSDPISYRFINSDGKIVFRGNFQAAWKGYDGYVPVMRNGLIGLLNTKGERILDYQFSSIDYVGNGYWKVKQDDKWGIINLMTGESVKCEYDSIGLPNEGFLPVKKGEFWGVVNYQGYNLIPFKYSEISEKVEHGMVVGRINQAYTVMNIDGKEILELSPYWVNTYITPNGLIVTQNMKNAEDKDRYEIYNAAGEYCNWSYVRGENVIPMRDDIVLFHNNDVQMNSTYGVLMDSNGKVVCNILESLKQNDASISKIRLYPESFNGEWMIVGLKKPSEKRGKETTFWNLVNLHGQLKYANGFETNSKNGMLWITDNTYLLNLPGEVDLLRNDKLYHFNSDEYDWFGRIGDRYFIIADNSVKSYIVDLENMQQYDFYKIDGGAALSPVNKGILDSCENFAFVSNGAYYGMITSLGMVEEGLCYDKYETYYEKTEVMLQIGTGKTVVHIGDKGTVYSHNGNQNIPLKVIPLSDGTSISWDSVPLQREMTMPAEKQPIENEEAAVVTNAEKEENKENAEFATFLGMTNLDNINVRETPEAKGKRVTQISEQGTTVTVLAIEENESEGKSYYYVELENGKTGYIRSDLVDKADTSTINTQPENTVVSGLQKNEASEQIDRIGYTNTRGVNVRTEPSTSNRRVTTVEKEGTALTVKSKVTNKKGELWYLVVTSDGDEGYIKADYITIGEP